MPRKRTRAKPNHDRDGNPICIVCGGPNDPEHPNSPYCVEHRAKARRDSVRLSRQRGKDADKLIAVVTNGREHEFHDNVYSGPSGIVFLPEKANELRADLGVLLSALSKAKSETATFTLPLGEEAYRLQIVALAEAVENYNEVLSPVLRRR